MPAAARELLPDPNMAKKAFASNKTQVATTTPSNSAIVSGTA